MSRILIVKLTAIGDIVHLSWILPVIKAVYPRVEVSWAVDSRYQGFLGLFSEIDQVIPIGMRVNDFSRNILDGIAVLKKQVVFLRQNRYDVVIDAQGLLKSAIVTALSRSPKKIGFAKPESREGSEFFYHVRVIAPKDKINVVDKYLSLFQTLGLSDYVKNRPSLNLSMINPIRVDSFLKRLGSSYKIIFNTSASFYTKHFPLEKIPPLAEAVRRELGCPLVILNNGDEKKNQKLPNHPDLVFAPLFPLEELPLLLSRFDFMIGVDSGPSYLAELVGLPSLILFGPTNLERQSPSSSCDPRLKEVFNPEGKVRHISSYSAYKCPIIKPGVITDSYRCLNRWCSNNLCMQSFDQDDLIERIKSGLRHNFKKISFNSVKSNDP